MAEGPAPLVTCEHGRREVPSPWRRLFRGREGVLRDHRAWDPGSLRLARRLSLSLGAPLLAAPFTRLLVDANRSAGHRELFSRYSRSLPAEERKLILERCYLPYRRSVQDAVAAAAARGRPCLHVAVHTFTPVRRGEVRRTDVGLLYDPHRRGERLFCLELRGTLLGLAPKLGVRRNYPYRGTSDGLTASLRRRFAEESYLGIEIEVNQRLLRQRQWPFLERALAEALKALLPGPPDGPGSGGPPP